MSEQLAWERLATNLRVERALLEVLPILDGLPVVVFKGTCLTRLLYGDLRMRASSDNDLWVPTAQVKEALTRLLGAGYRPLPSIDPWKALDRFGQVALLAPGNGDDVSVDLHAYPFSRRLFDVPETELLDHIEPMRLSDEVTVQTFDRVATFAQLIAHWSQHLLDDNHLPDIATAWERWGASFSSAEFAQIESWITSPAMELALYLSQPASERSPSTTRLGTRADLARRFRQAAHPLAHRAASLVLCAPDKLPSNFVLFFFPTTQELHSRYGPGPKWQRRIEHLFHLATGR